MTEITYSYGKMRFWEMLPGTLAWGTILLAILFSFVAPFWAVVFIIVFDVYWLVRVLYFVVYLFVAWKSYRQTIKVNWEEKLQDCERAERLHHLIFLPTYQEPYEVVRATFESIRASAFPNERIMIILAGEGRDQEQFRSVAAKIKGEYASVFKRIYFTEHPSGLPDEIPGKGSNLHYAGKQVEGAIVKEFPAIRDEDIIVSSFDVDTVAHEQYFAYLAYLYCTTPNPERHSYQPVALFSNNIWDSPAPVRIAAFGTTFWLMGELSRPDRLWTFSSHSMPWKMLKDVGFWQKDIVSEDSRIFMQAFIRYNGNYGVVPMYLPVSMDTVVGATYWEYMVALYKQLRRWAWGVEHLPMMAEAFKKNKEMPKRLKFKYLFNHIEGMYTWATAPILIFLLGWLPLQLAKGGEVLVEAAPFTLEALMRLALIGVFVTGGFALALLPPRPAHVKRRAWFVMILQWALLPITFIVFGAIPALDAQTRLMLGKYLGFNVTKKTRS